MVGILVLLGDNLHGRDISVYFESIPGHAPRKNWALEILKNGHFPRENLDLSS